MEFVIWIRAYLTSSIGKKQVVAVTGLLLFLFLIAHLAGNLLLFAGKDAFNAYVKSMEDFGFFLILAEVLLGILFLTHIFFALLVSKENFQARPEKYAVSGFPPNRTRAAYSMPITGGITLVFLAIHLWNFRVEKALNPQAKDMYTMVSDLFQHPGYVAWYVFGVFLLGIHLSHGLQSSVRTLGLSNPNFLRIAELKGRILAWLIAGGYVSFPLYFFFIGDLS